MTLLFNVGDEVEDANRRDILSGSPFPGGASRAKISAKQHIRLENLRERDVIYVDVDKGPGKEPVRNWAVYAGTVKKMFSGPDRIAEMFA